MGWQDRSYYRDSSNGTGNPLMWLLTGSVPLFRVFGIHVRLHASLLLLFVLMTISAILPGGMGLKYALTLEGVLFGVVLLHEFGHCFAARRVGGDANEIVMGPLGGLAFADAPNRPWPQLITTAGGPLVNVLICILTAAAMAILNRGDPNVAWNPLSNSFHIPMDSTATYLLWFVFVVSWGLLLFNLLPIFPLDGGRMLQEILWFFTGYYRSMMIALTVGIVGSVIMGVWGIMHLGSWYGLMLFLIGVSCLYTCYVNRAMLKAAGPFSAEAEEEPDYASSLYEKPEKPRKHHLSKRMIRKAQKREAKEREEQERVDQILAKVSAHGMMSLSWWERRILRKATQHQRERDLEIKEVGRRGV